MRVLVFGASVTQGFWDTEGGWVQRLRRHYDTLQVKDFTTEQPTIFNLGVSGHSTPELLARFKNETQARIHRNETFAFIFSIGTNNAREENGKMFTTVETYKKDLEELVGQAEEFSNKIMFVGLPPCDESRTTPVAWRNINYRNENIWQMETAMRAVCAENNLPHVPIFETFQARQQETNLLADGLHPNNEGHGLMASLVQPELDKLIAS